MTRFITVLMCINVLLWCIISVGDYILGDPTPADWKIFLKILCNAFIGAAICMRIIAGEPT